MQLMTHPFRALFLLFVFSGFAWTQGAMAAPPINDAAALAELKTGKGVFLVDINGPKKTAFYLETILGTYQGMKSQGVTPDFVLVFIGPTVQYLSTEPSDELEFEYQAELQSIATSVEALNTLGVRLEVCAVATRVFGIDNTTILPGMHMVGDGFISLIGWQSQGYRLVPVF